MRVYAISGTVDKLRKAGVSAALRVEETSESAEILVTLQEGLTNVPRRNAGGSHGSQKGLTRTADSGMMGDGGVYHAHGY